MMDDRFAESIRLYLLAGVLRFVQAARRLDGILVGSLTTAEPDPHDADLLVTVRDNADLAPLATIGRELKGHAQQRNRGAAIGIPRKTYCRQFKLTVMEAVKQRELCPALACRDYQIAECVLNRWSQEARVCGGV